MSVQKLSRQLSSFDQPRSDRSDMRSVLRPGKILFKSRYDDKSLWALRVVEVAVSASRVAARGTMYFIPASPWFLNWNTLHLHEAGKKKSDFW